MIRATPMTPPMTPPAIAPAFELLLDDDDDEEAGEDAPGVIVDWLLVELGTLEALPVTSGESPTLCAKDEFQKSDPVGSRYAQCGTRVAAGMASGKVPGLATEVQLYDHEE
jgi:hypothetical protein